MTTNHRMLVLLALWLAGCSSQTAPPAPKSDVHEVWDIVQLQQNRVGVRHFRAAPDTLDSQPAVRVDSDMTFRVLRAAQPIEQKTATITWETPQGRMLRFETRSQFGAEPTLTRGRVEGGELKIETEQAGRKTPGTVAWPSDGDGPEGVELSLLRKPMRPGERRRIVAFAPILNTVSVVQMVAVGKEATELLTGNYELLRIDAVTEVSGLTIHGKLWADASGNVLKQWIQEPLEQTLYRTTKEIALGEATPASFDLTLATNVLLKGKMPKDLHAAQQARYRVRMTGDDPASLFAVGQSQQVASQNVNTADVTVRAIRPETPLLPGVFDAPPTAEDLAASALVQLDAPPVVALAAAGAPEGGEPWKTAVAFEQFVQRKIKNKNFSQALGSAAEVAEHLEGDCTEHAVLLAALLRARKIPSRVALGMVYAPSERSMVFHMWTEAYLGDRWIPLDATLGRGGIGAGHLKLANSSLADGSALASFLTVAKALGRLQIELIEEK
ncbi:MAG: transglutaminase family protein [Planctomycetes bacterium]|nr:transglutaminase family protein [Planctomycetota bacterium]